MTKNHKIKTCAALPPKTFSEAMMRETLSNMYKHIKEPHCTVCADTESQEELFKINNANDANAPSFYLCKFCYNVQMSM